MIVISANNYWGAIPSLYVFNFTKTLWSRYIIIPILQMRKLELREVIEFA